MSPKVLANVLRNRVANLRNIVRVNEVKEAKTWLEFEAVDDRGDRLIVTVHKVRFARQEPTLNLESTS